MTTPEVYKPNNHYVMVFDVETTGLLPKFGDNELKNYPYIFQVVTKTSSTRTFAYSRN